MSERDYARRHHGVYLIANCGDCKWMAEGAGTSAADNARAKAKRHHESTGHQVFIDRTAFTTLGLHQRPKKRPDERRKWMPRG